METWVAWKLCFYVESHLNILIYIFGSFIIFIGKYMEYVCPSIGPYFIL